MRILVTGANGQLGMSLRPLLRDAVFTDIGELDITDLAAIRAMVAREDIDTIVNCAGYTNVEEAEVKPELAELLNAKAVENLAVAMKEVNGLLVHISTDYVFGGESLNTPIPENQKPAPQGAYSLSKLHGEEAVQRVGCRHIIIRTAWLYSEYGKNFVKTMLRLTAEKPSLKVVDDQRGTPTFAGDLADVIVRLLSAEGDTPPVAFARTGSRSDAEGGVSPSVECIYNFTDEGECTWYEFACEIARLSGHTACEIRPCTSDEFPSKVHRPAYSVLDKSKIKGVLGISIPHWSESLQKCLGRI